MLGDVGANISLPLVGGGIHDIALRLAFTGPTGVSTVELPGVAVDALVEDQAVEDPGVFNRSPEPGEASVPLGAPIAFDVYDTQGNAVDPSRTTVTVNGVVVYRAGAFASGWST